MATESDSDAETTSADASDNTNDGGGTADNSPSEREEELSARIALLEAENERLRREYRRATRATYRKTAGGLFVLGVLALAGAALFPAARTVFIALGGVGCFGGILTYYLTPERVLTASVAQQLVETMHANTQGLVDELGLQNEALFLPDDAGQIWLFRPQHPEYDLPDVIERLFVISKDVREQGVALVPVGGGLFEAFERGLAGGYADDIEQAADQLSEAIVEQFELAAAVTVDAAPDQERVVFGVSDPAISPVGAVEHPIPSFLGTALARHRDGPVRAMVREGDDRYDATVVIEWNIQERGRETGEN